MCHLPPYLFGQLNSLKYQKRRAGADIIDLGMGNPHDATPPPVVEKLCEAVQDPRNHRYSDATGILNLRREVAKFYRQKYGVELDPETEIISTIGSKEGFSHLCLALLGPGDVAIVPNPAFPPHIYAVTIAGASVLSVPISEPPEFLENLAAMTEAVFPKPKLLVLNFPHNPTTATVDPGFFDSIVSFARKHSIMVVHDFAYGQTVFDDYVAPSFLQAEGAREVGVEIMTMSKAYNMAGWRVGFCLGNKEMIESLSAIKGYFDYGLFQPVQIASIIALRHCDEYVAGQAMAYQSRRDVLCDGLNRIGWKVRKPRASMFVWAPIPDSHKEIGSIDFSFMLMEKAEVAVAPGKAFGEEGEGYLRFALVENEHRIRQAVRQIRRGLA
jgi:alanine-synthesizing transaminase